MNKHQAGQRTAVTHKAAVRPVATLAKASAKRLASGKTKVKPRVDGEARRAMVAEAAYFRAEKRGFADGGELSDWLEAEREIGHILDSAASFPYVAGEERLTSPRRSRT